MQNGKTKNLLDATSDTVPRCFTRKWIEVHDQFKGSCNTNKQIKHQCYNQIYVITVVAVKELLLLQIQMMMHMVRY